MIYCKDNCPICGKKLETRKWIRNKKEMDYIYLCPQETCFDGAVKRPHYQYQILDGEQVDMIIPPFYFKHYRHRNMTRVFLTPEDDFYPQKFVLELPTLDTDWSKPHIVINKIRTLMTFS